MLKQTPIVIDALTSLPVFVLAIWATCADPFAGEQVFWGAIALCSLLVMLPTIVRFRGHSFSRRSAIPLSVFYSLMLLAGLYILLYDSTYGPWWELVIICAFLVSITKSLYFLWRVSP
jgi:hypothetical protein